MISPTPFPWQIMSYSQTSMRHAKDPGDISSKDIADRLEKLGTDVTYLGDFESIKNFLKKNLMHDDLLITMGAGNIVEVGEDLVKC